jgi:hypothetical protein
MSGSEQFPPPGAPAPGPAPGPQPAYQPAPPAYASGPMPGTAPAVTGFYGAAHKPGAIPLRPLGLGDMYDGALKIIRFNPKATVGSAVLVASVAMAVPIVITAVVTFAFGLTLDLEATSFSTSEVVGLVVSMGSLVLGLILQSLGLVLVTGMVAHVTAAAAIGQRLSIGEAWARTRGKRWRLIALTTLLGLVTLLGFGAYAALWIPVIRLGDVGTAVVFGLVTAPLFLAAIWWFWIRVYYLPVPALMLEPIGVFGAIGRGYRLTRKAFWRTFGIGMLTLLVTSIAGQVLATPIALIGQVAAVAGATSAYGTLILVVSQALSSVVTAAFVGPFTSAVTSLQYLDQRIRKEAYDVELMTQAGITAR